ncbi:mutator type transposase [Tanacetum coccineum]
MDVDVDMKDFDFHVDEGVEFMGCRDIEQTVDIEEGDGEEIEVLDILESTLFSIKLHYGGVFTKSPNRKYINGNITFVDMIDSDEFSVHEIDSMLEDLGQDGHRVMFYHFLKPGCDLDNGLEPIACDRDVVVLGNYVTQGLKLVEVFVEHEKTNPDIYTPPKAKRLVIEELDAEPIISKAGITPVARKLVLDVNNNQTCGKEKGKSSGKDLEGQSSAVGNDGSYEESQDPNFDPFADLDLILPTMGDREGNTSEHVDLGDETNNVEIECDDDRHGEEHTGGDHEIHDEEEREVDDDTDRNMEGNSGHVVETEGEENEQAIETESEEDTEANDETDSEDSDYLVDEENNVDDVDVDMKDFDFHVDEGVEFMGCRDSEQTVDIEEGDGEEIEVLDNDYFESASDSDDEGSRLRKRKLKEIRKQAHANEQIYKTYFYVGKDFPNKEDAMTYIKEHSIETRREIRFEKNDGERVRAVCRGVIPCLPCVDEITSGANQVIGPSQGSGPSQVSGPSEGIGSKVKWTKKKIAVTRSPQKLTINGGKPNSKKQLDGNQCPWVLLVSKIKTVKHGSSAIKIQPLHSVRAVQEQLTQKHELNVTQSKAFRSKQEAEKKLRGDYTQQYKMLRDYVMELQETNPNTTVKIHVQSEANHEVPTRVFKRIYVCLGPLKAGFKVGMRDLLGLDGAFMKGLYPCQVLTAVGVDPNNGIYPLAYGLVENENTESWTWFLTQLGDDLELYRNSNFTFVSDRQKGIIPAIANLFPNAEHRYCVKHIHENMKKRWNGNAYKELLWTAASTTTVPEFQKAMEKLKEFSKEAYEWLNLIPPQHWSRSHFSVRAKSDVLLNNMCEVFNGKLVGGRDKPIISTLEFAREYLMKRIVNVNKLIDKCDGPLTPTATKILRANSNQARKYTVVSAGDGLYQVSGPWDDQVVVNVVARTCTCRRWELTGIPCKHVVATNWVMSLNNEAGIPEEWVHPCYRLETWKKVYSFKIKPIRGHIHWPKCNVPTTILPPKHQPQVGRPPKERKKSAAERDLLKIVKNGKLSREHKTVTCNKCNTKGHNSRSCTGPRVAKTNKRKVPTTGMDDTHAPTGSQANKRPKTQGVGSASGKTTNKGKAPAASGGVPKKTGPKKKVINLG